MIQLSHSLWESKSTYYRGIIYSCLLQDCTFMECAMKAEGRLAEVGGGQIRGKAEDKGKEGKEERRGDRINMVQIYSSKRNYS